jgi:hypothetical protein
MQTIDLRNITSGFSSNSDALPLFSVLDKTIKNNEKLTLEIDNSLSLSSSFLNSSFGEIISLHGLEAFKASLKINTTKSQFQRLAKYVHKYTQLYSA